MASGGFIYVCDENEYMMVLFSYTPDSKIENIEY